MPKLQRRLFSRNFNPEEDTAILNAILEELYSRLEGTLESNPPQCRVYRETNQTIANSTSVAISFSAERWDTDTMWDSTNPTQVIAKTDGYYLFIANLQWANTALGGRRFVQLRKNGTTAWAFEEQKPDPTSNFVGHSVSAVIPMSVNDYIELVVHQTTGGNLDILTSANFSPELSASLVSH